MNYPIAQNEAQRLAKLCSYNLLDTSPEPSIDHITRIAARLFQMPMAAVSLVDENRQWFKSRLGLTHRQSSRSESFCTHAILADNVLVVPDPFADARFNTNPYVTGYPGIRFYAGAPLCAESGIRLGTLCVMDVMPRTFTADDERVLAALAGVVVDEFATLDPAPAGFAEGETHFAQLIDQAGDGFFLCGLDGMLVEANQEACETLGYHKTELLRLRLTDVEITGAVGKYLGSCIGQAPGRPETIAGRCRRRDGTTFPIEGRVSIVKRSKGDLILAVVRDVTAREQAETLLQQAKAEAEQANSSKTEFMVRMSHDLRTPLNAVLGFGHLLGQQATSPAMRDCTGHIVKSAERLLALVNQLPGGTRLGTQSFQILIQPVQIANVIRACVHEVRSSAADRNIIIGLSSAAARPYRALTDSQCLHQLLVRLLSNAIKRSGDSAGIAVDYHLIGDQVRICVHDRGAEIGAGEIDRLFKWSEHCKEDGDGRPGPGADLALCRQVIEANGGMIGAESTNGRGNTFWIQLPAAERCDALEEPSSKAPDQIVVTSPARPAVLYIDDDQSNLDLIACLINVSQEMRLLTATSGASGVEIARRQHPDIILLDLHLPDLDGEEVLSRLRGDPATSVIPVVAVSGEIAAEKMARLTAAGVRWHLIKPLNLKEVLQVLLTLLKRPAGA